METLRPTALPKAQVMMMIVGDQGCRLIAADLLDVEIPATLIQVGSELSH